MNIINFKKKLIKIPLSFSGIGLGIASFGNLTESISSDFTKDIVNYNDINNNIFQTICMIVAFIIIGIIIMRIFASLDNFKKELRDPLLCGLLPLIPVFGGLLAGYIASIPTFNDNTLVPTVNAATIIGAIILIACILFHVVILFYFLFFTFKNKNQIKDGIFASWFMPPVTIIIYSIVSFNFPSAILPDILFQIIWYFGFLMFIIFAPYSFYKIVFADNLPEDKIPTIAVLASPSSITLLGFLSVFVDKGSPVPGYNESFIVSIVLILVMLSFCSALFLILILFKILRTKFNPSYSSLGLAAVITPLAMFETHIFFREHESSVAIANLFLAISLIETVFATIMIFVLSSKFFISIPKWIKLDPVLKN